MKKPQKTNFNYTDSFLDFINQVKAPAPKEYQYVHGLDRPRQFSQLELQKQRRSNLAADCGRDRTARNNSYTL